ncbi:MAG: c-type cytochrome [Proteobacteria bacterium]|nr:c-type cytochrome [Pseudomonadota bacterium]
MVFSSLFDNAQQPRHQSAYKLASAISTESSQPQPFDFGSRFSLHYITRWLWPLLVLNLFLVSDGLAEDAGNLYNTNFDINAGRSYFEKQCSRCHGFDARGNDEVGAPNLTGRLTRASSSAGIYTILREGISGTAMMAVDPQVPDSQLWQLAAYIESLSRESASIAVRGSAEVGRALFNEVGECLDCHMLNGKGGRLGPDLSNIGSDLSPNELTLALIDPSEKVAPRWWSLTLEDKNGVSRSGLRMNEDSFSVRIMDADSQLWSYPRSALRRVVRSEESTMPSYAARFSDTQIDDLVAFLYSLRPETTP